MALRGTNSAPEARPLARTILKRAQCTVNAHARFETCADYVFHLVVPFFLPRNGYHILTEKRQCFLATRHTPHTRAMSSSLRQRRRAARPLRTCALCAFKIRSTGLCVLPIRALAMCRYALLCYGYTPWQINLMLITLTNCVRQLHKTIDILFNMRLTGYARAA